MKISEVITNKQPKTSQIELESVIPVQSILTQRPKPKVAHTHQKEHQVSTQPIPDQIKHKLIQDRLTMQFLRQRNIVKPTSDDIRIALNRTKTAIKRRNLEFKRRSD